MRSSRLIWDCLRISRHKLLDLLMDSIPPDGVMSTDDPGFHDELGRRMNDLSDLILWSEVRDKK